MNKKNNFKFLQFFPYDLFPSSSYLPEKFVLPNTNIRTILNFRKWPTLHIFEKNSTRLPNARIIVTFCCAKINTLKITREKEYEKGNFA